MTKITLRDTNTQEETTICKIELLTDEQLLKLIHQFISNRRG